MNYTSFIFSLNSESHFQETNPNRKCLILHVALTTTATSNITSCQRLIPHAAWIAIPSFNNIAKYFATHHHHHLRHYHICFDSRIIRRLPCQRIHTAPHIEYDTPPIHKPLEAADGRDALVLSSHWQSLFAVLVSNMQ